MANHRQAEKRDRQRIKRQARNRRFKTAMRTLIKRTRAAIGEKSLAGADEALKAAIPMIDRVAQKGIIPRARASRMISRLTTAVNGLRS